MSDPTENIRRDLLEAINTGAILPEGQEWNTDQLTEDFQVLGFLAPFVVVRHKATNKKGSLMFKHHPRIYFGWKED